MKNRGQCLCGPLHYTDAKIEHMIKNLIEELGENIPVSISSGTWLVPRHYIALHGLKARELSELAKKYGLERVS